MTTGSDGPQWTEPNDGEAGRPRYQTTVLGGRQAVGENATYNERPTFFHQVVQARERGWQTWFLAPAAVVGVLLGAIFARVVPGWSGPAVAASVGALLVVVGLTWWHGRRVRQRTVVVARAARAEALVPLVAPAPGHGVASLATLVAADRALAPLESRRAQVRDLLEWCLDPQAAPVRILAGPPGVGKTRLAVESGRQLPRDWVTGFCRPGQANRVLGLVEASPDPTLIVVDDADAQPDVPRLVEAVALREGGRPVRVLLVARNGGALSLTLGREVRESVRADWPTTSLEVEGSEGDRRRWFGRAVTAYAAAAGRAVPPTLLSSKDPVGDEVEPMMILQVRAALTALSEDPARQAPAYRRALIPELGAALVAHERSRWRQAGEDARWQLPKKLTVEGREEAMFALIASAPATPDDASTVLRRVPRFAEQDEDRLRRIGAWAHHLYPGPVLGGSWVEPSPAFLLGALLAHLARPDVAVLLGSLDLASSVAARGHPALFRLIRCASQFPALLPVVDSVLDRSPELLVDTIDHSIRAGLDDSVLRSVLVGLIGRHPFGEEPARRLVVLAPETSWPELRVALRRLLVGAARAQYDVKQSDSARSRLATTLHHLSLDLWEVGDPRGALTAISESVTLGRTLYTADPDRYGADIASALNRQGVYLAEVGEHRDALAASREAVDLRRKLVHADDPGSRAGLADAVNNLGVRLSAIGEAREALDRSREAVHLYRELVGPEPGLYRAELAGCLTNLAIRLASVGELREALSASRDSVELYRELTRTDRVDHRAALAGALNNFGVDLSSVGEVGEALGAANEAVGLYEELYESEPERYTAKLAGSLSNFGGCLAAVGEGRRALGAATEAVALYRDIFALEPAGYRAELAVALSNLGIRLSSAGMVQEALDAALEAVALRRELVEAEPTRYRADLSTSLNNLGGCFSAIGKERAALDAVRESVQLNRLLFAAEPEGHRSALADSLYNLSGRLSAVGEDGEASNATREAVGLYRILAKAEPARYTADLGFSLTRLADALAQQGRTADALNCQGERAAFWGHLARMRPADFADRYRREQGQLLEFCSLHGLSMNDGVRAERDARAQIEDGDSS